MSSFYEHLGEYLVNKKIVTKEQVKSALSKQKHMVRTGKKGLLGQLLIEMGYCTEEDITMALAEKAGVPYMSLKDNPPNPSVVKLLKPALAKAYEALPIAFKDDKLLVAMKQPNDMIAIDDISIFTGHNIQPVMVCDSELDNAIRCYYNNNDFFSIPDKNTKEPPVSNLPAVPSTMEAINIDTLDSDNSIVKITNTILSQAVTSGASDIHIEELNEYVRVRFRIDGVLNDIMKQPKEIYTGILSRFKVMAGMDITDRRNPQDGRISLRINNKMIDLRVATLPTLNNEKLTIRILTGSIRLKDIYELGFLASQLEIIKKIIHKTQGILLVTGPTGSGKSTTLYSILTQLNTPEKNIITLEDPIEMRIQGITQSQINPKTGFTFPVGLRATLRNDPDIIMIGEIRDLETVKTAVEAALTGHLVLATLHTNDSASAITKLIEMGIEPYIINTALTGVVSQRLIRILCSDCKTEYKITSRELMSQFSDFPVQNIDKELTLYKPKGCSRCNFTGYKGRKGIFEILINNDSINPLIARGKPSRAIHETAVKEGMISLAHAGWLNVLSGVTSISELMRILI